MKINVDKNFKCMIYIIYFFDCSVFLFWIFVLSMCVFIYRYFVIVLFVIVCYVVVVVKFVIVVGYCNIVFVGIGKLVGFIF